MSNFKIGNRVVYGNTRNTDTSEGKIVGFHETRTGNFIEIQEKGSKKITKARAGLVRKI